MTVQISDSAVFDGARRELEQQLDERLAVLEELKPFAVPSLDPVAFQSAESHRAAVEQITAALNRIAAGTYGLCTRCGTQIAPGRLEALPHAATCIECQSHADAA